MKCKASVWYDVALINSQSLEDDGGDLLGDGDDLLGDGGDLLGDGGKATPEASPSFDSVSSMHLLKLSWVIPIGEFGAWPSLILIDIWISVLIIISAPRVE